MIEVVGRISEDGKTTGFKCNDNGKIAYYDLKTVRSNIDKFNIREWGSGFRFRGNNKSIKSLPDVKIIQLYHGSRTGINGEIRYDKSRTTCDFGLGFYTGDRIEQAEGLVCQEKDNAIYKLTVDVTDLKIYEFKSEIEWALYVGVNRGFIPRGRNRRLDELVDNINDNYDIVKGLIADDRMIYVFDNFMKHFITDKCLTECLKRVKLGNQYVFKTEKACRRIKIDSIKRMDENDRKRDMNNRKRTIGRIQGIVENIIIEHNGKGKYFTKVLQQFK